MLRPQCERRTSGDSPWALQRLHERLNVNGGACALGHPIGAGILVTLIHALRQRGLRCGIASLRIGGSKATATAIELT